jgi:hypothetical protein
VKFKLSLSHGYSTPPPEAGTTSSKRQLLMTIFQMKDMTENYKNIMNKTISYGYGILAVTCIVHNSSTPLPPTIKSMPPPEHRRKVWLGLSLR